jgi:hypothetical protein
MLEPLRLLVPEHPRTLAALRISVTAILLVSPETYAAERIAALPHALLRRTSKSQCASPATSSRFGL